MRYLIKLVGPMWLITRQGIVIFADRDLAMVMRVRDELRRAA